MRRTLAPLLVVTMIVVAACTPKQPEAKPSKPVFVAAVVKLCIENPFDIRRDEHFCGPERPDDCCSWEYLSFIPESSQVELPAVGETLRLGQGHPQPPPGSTPLTVPTQGAIWRHP